MPYVFHHETDSFAEFVAEIRSVATALGLFDNPPVAAGTVPASPPAQPLPPPPPVTEPQPAPVEEPDDEQPEDEPPVAAAPEKPKRQRGRPVRTPEQAEAAAEARAQAQAANGKADPRDDGPITTHHLVAILKQYEMTYGYKYLVDDAGEVLMAATGVKSIGKLAPAQMETARDALQALVDNNPNQREPLNG